MSYYVCHGRRVKSKDGNNFLCECGKLIKESGMPYHIQSEIHKKILESKSKSNIISMEKSVNSLNNVSKRDVSKYQREYYKNRKEKINCECGRSLYKHNLDDHLKTEIHKKFMRGEGLFTKNINEYHKNYYENYKERINCECGRSVYKHNLDDHKKTEIHNKLIRGEKISKKDRYKYYKNYYKNYDENFIIMKKETDDFISPWDYPSDNPKILLIPESNTENDIEKNFFKCVCGPIYSPWDHPLDHIENV
jgi:hypothetical protein